MERRFTGESLSDIYKTLATWSASAAPGMVTAFEVLDPDHAAGHYAGTLLVMDGITYRARGYRSWNDLARLLSCRMLTPRSAMPPCVTLRFQKLEHSQSFHTAETADRREKYGTASLFAAIDKNEEPAFYATYTAALKAVGIEKRRRILDLGVNSGDEFETIRCLMGPEAFMAAELVGIDHSNSAIEVARKRFPAPNVTFYAHDINCIDTLELAPFDLLVSIGTLQSPGIDFKPLFMYLVQHCLIRHEAALILGFPNCRWMDGEMLYGAKAPNYSYPELSLLIKDIHYCKKYLQQKGFRVTVTGKEYLFLTATPIRKRATP